MPREWSARVLAPLLLAVFAGCASPPSKTVIDSVDTVAVVESVELPAKPVFLGVASTFNGWGLLGGAIAARDLTHADRLSMFLQEHHMNFGAMLADAFNRRLKSTTVANKVAANATHRFVVRVSLYGLGKTYGFDNRMRTIIAAESTLLDGNGKKAWKTSVNTDSLKESERVIRTLEEWVQHPDELRKELEANAEYIAGLLLAGW